MRFWISGDLDGSFEFVGGFIDVMESVIGFPTVVPSDILRSWL